MSRKKSGVNFSKSVLSRERRRSALTRLENQLKSGVKTKKIDGINQTVDLSPKDISRIEKEILTLKERI